MRPTRTNINLKDYKTKKIVYLETEDAVVWLDYEKQAAVVRTEFSDIVFPMEGVIDPDWEKLVRPELKLVK